MPQGMAQGATILPGEDLLPQSFAKVTGGLDHPPRAGGAIPRSPERFCLTGTQQARGTKPAQQGGEIGKQLDRFSVLQRTGIHEIKGQLVSEE